MSLPVTGRILPSLPEHQCNICIIDPSHNGHTTGWIIMERKDSGNKTTGLDIKQLLRHLFIHSNTVIVFWQCILSLFWTSCIDLYLMVSSVAY